MDYLESKTEKRTTESVDLVKPFEYCQSCSYKYYFQNCALIVFHVQLLTLTCEC